MSMQRIHSIFRYVAVIAASVSLACDPVPPATVANILVDFPGTTAANPALLLYSGKEGADCKSYEPNVANPTVTLSDVSYDPTCYVEVDAFAPGLGALVNSIDPAAPGSEGWLVGAIETGTLALTLPSVTPVPLQIWIVANAPHIATAESMRNRLLDKAYPIFDTFGTGLTLDTASAIVAPGIVGTRCQSGDVIAANPAIYDASRINVYFIEDYANIQDLTPAQNCWLHSHPEIIFISWGNPNVTDPTLAHELGHALGLVRPHFYGGHTYGIPEFDDYNLMASNTDVTNVTIGQLYALNFSSESWLNRSGSPFARPIVKECQDVWGAGTCPALTLAVPPGWPPP